MADVSVPSWLAKTAGITAALVTIYGGVRLIDDAYMPATRGWVAGYESREVLLLKRQVRLNELFLWESNKEPNENIRWNIARLKAELADIEAQLAARRH
jgi:hypothetical protein